jgi:atypical dual specificity phosphatase
LLVDVGTWLPGGHVVACAYPRGDDDLAALSERGVSVVVNLHERAHVPAQVARFQLTEVHIPVKDFTAPSAEQLEQGVRAIHRAIARGERVAVHCGAGLGRTGTLLACYLVDSGLSADAAIEQVRALRPGSVETAAQAEAVATYAARRRQERQYWQGRLS